MAKAKTTRQGRVAHHQNAATSPPAIEQVKPVSIRDLPEVAEAAALLDRPEQLSGAPIHRLPAQAMGHILLRGPGAPAFGCARRR